MEHPGDDLTGTREYAYYQMMDELLTLVIDFAREARHCEDKRQLGVYLKLMSRCTRCALQIYMEELTEEVNDVSRNHDVKPC
jgi:hypothetical protein